MGFKEDNQATNLNNNKTAYIETSAINFCVDHGVKIDDFTNLLRHNNLVPVVGIYTTYELARCVLSKEPHKTKTLFDFMQGINPSYSDQRDNLYKKEGERLKSGLPFDYKLPTSLLFKLKERVDDYCCGRSNKDHEYFIEKRQKELLEMRERKINWLNKNIKNEDFIDLHKKYKKLNTFEDFLKQRLNDLPNNKEKINCLMELLKSIGVNFNKNETVELIQNLHSYPALRTCFYNHLYLQYQTIKHLQVPRKDRFTDGLQMIESSYCDTFMCRDDFLRDNQAPKVNPSIELINIKDFLQKNNY